MEMPFCLCNIKGRRDVFVGLLPKCYLVKGHFGTCVEANPFWANPLEK